MSVAPLLQFPNRGEFSQAASEEPARCHRCGGEWFRLEGWASGSNEVTNGAVTMSGDGRITGYYGSPVCTECGLSQ